MHHTKAELEAEEQVELTTLERVERLADQQGEIFRAYQTDKIRYQVVALVLGVGFILLGAALVFGWQDRDRLESAVTAIEEQRATARQSSCDQAVDFSLAHNDLVRRTQELLVAISSITSNPSTQQFIAEQVELYNANIVRVRDCSPQGLLDFANDEGGYLP